MSDSESDQSDIVIKSALLMPKSNVKLPTNPVEKNNASKKATTKSMIHEALTELKTRKGVSLHAIKKYLIEKYSVDTERINFLIKKTINSGVKDGSIIQTKGVGAAGSFKLASEKTQAKPKSKLKKPDKPKKEKKTESEKPKKEKKTETEKPKKDKKTEPESKTKKAKPKKADDEKVSQKKKDSKIEKKIEKKDTKTTEEVKDTKDKVSKKPKVTKSEKKVKMAVQTSTPVQKKAASIKIRRSIGNIIKPPKMNPKSTSN